MKRTIAKLLAGIFLVLMHIGMFTDEGVWATIGVVLCELVVVAIYMALTARSRRLQQHQQHAQTVARADYEHAAIMRGDGHLGVYGEFPPADL